MKPQKIKRYRLGVSRNFPTTHARKGEPTYFIEKILSGVFGRTYLQDENKKKIHTIRGNYELWSKRMAKVQAGRAVIELFYWSGKPYHKDENGVGQVVFATLDKDSGCGLQKVEFALGNLTNPTVDNTGQLIDMHSMELINELAKNDGLSLEDFKEWFKKYNLSKPMVIIHFTSFRY